MRVLLLRIGALGVLVVLGWIAIAHAQRDGSTPSDAASSPVVSDQSAQDGGTGNPLRPPATTSTQTIYPPAGAATRQPRANAPSRDPFGLESRHSETAKASNPPGRIADTIPDASAIGSAASRDARWPSRYQQGAVPVSADQPIAGPSLNLDAGQARNERVAPANASAERPAGGGAPRNGNTAAPAELREPAHLQVDPFSMPANPMRMRSPAKPQVANISPPVEVAHTSAISTEIEGAGQPGAPQLEGVQSPQLTIQKVAPKEIQVGKPATFRITARNTGQAPASDVEIRDAVPRGTRLLGTSPQAKSGPRGEVVWSLGNIRPGEEATVEMQLMPTAEGEIGSVATVHFGADASVRTMATRPQLTVETTAPGKVLIGQQAVLSITVSNTGTGMASGVVLQERIPAGFQHPAGADLEYEVGNLKAGESRKIELPLVAKQAGLSKNILSVRAEGDLRVEKQLDIEVLAPQLDVAMKGPKRRYLERQATYEVSVHNPGTAPAKQVELIASLPPGLKFIRANNAGYYEESSRTVRWRLEELPAQEIGSVELVTMPVEAGQQAIKVRGVAQQGLSVEKEQPVLIEGISAILFQVADAVDPLEVGGETTYEVHVVNQGSKAASNIRLTVVLPPEAKFVAAEGPTRYQPAADCVKFEGLGQLPPKADTTYRVRIKAVSPGDLRARFELLTDDMRTPVVKEESTRVFADE